MKPKRFMNSLYLWCLGGLLLLSCQSSEDFEQQEERFLKIAPQWKSYVEMSTSTRGILDASSTTETFNVGLFVCNHADGSLYTPHIQGYNNIKGEVNAAKDILEDTWSFKWKFFPLGVTEGYDELGVRLDGNETVDVYAYMPYKEGEEDLKPNAIPFTTSQENVMYASSQDEPGGDTDKVELTFHHALTCLSFMIKTITVGTINLEAIGLQNCKFEEDEKFGFIANSFILDATTGELKELKYSSNEISVNINAAINTNNPTNSFNVFMPEIKSYNDPKGIRLRLKFNGNWTQSCYLPQPPADNGEYPFGKGKRYIYHIDVDDFTKISPKIQIKGFSTSEEENQYDF